MFGRKRHEKHKTNLTSSMIIHQFDRQHDSTTENDLNRSESDAFKSMDINIFTSSTLIIVNQHA